MLTVYGIETSENREIYSPFNNKLQQCLPFTVLKPPGYSFNTDIVLSVATVLTVYGIETMSEGHNLQYLLFVATVLTVYGIETEETITEEKEFIRLQQCLPFTVLKRL